MTRYRIADLDVEMSIGFENERLDLQCRAYRLPKTVEQDPLKEPDIRIACSELALEEALKRAAPEMTIADCEYVLTGRSFYYQLLDYQGFMLHASALSFEGGGYLFSAASGVGKSTHTKWWQHLFGTENVSIINDDKPALRSIHGQFFVFGTPWSGKSDKNINCSVPLRGITFLEQGTSNKICQIPPSEAICLLMDQTVRPTDLVRMEKLLQLLDHLLRTIPVYKMKCTIGREAVQTAYQAMIST